MRAACGQLREKCAMTTEGTDIVVKMRNIEIIRVKENGDIVLSSAGEKTPWLLHTLNDILNLVGVQVLLGKATSEWSVKDGRTLMRFYDGLVIQAKGAQNRSRAQTIKKSFNQSNAKAAVEATMASDAVAAALGLVTSTRPCAGQEVRYTGASGEVRMGIGQGVGCRGGPVRNRHVPMDGMAGERREGVGGGGSGRRGYEHVPRVGPGGPHRDADDKADDDVGYGQWGGAARVGPQESQMDWSSNTHSVGNGHQDDASGAQHGGPAPGDMEFMDESGWGDQDWGPKRATGQLDPRTRRRLAQGRYAPY
eukprot:evm.model.scf_972.2 EVM.evm.TU.scf_972.2   scf_972:6163-11675(+)